MERFTRMLAAAHGGAPPGQVSNPPTIVTIKSLRRMLWRMFDLSYAVPPSHSKP